MLLFVSNSIEGVNSGITLLDLSFAFKSLESWFWICFIPNSDSLFSLSFDGFFQYLLIATYNLFYSSIQDFYVFGLYHQNLLQLPLFELCHLGPRHCCSFPVQNMNTTLLYLVNMHYNLLFNMHYNLLTGHWPVSWALTQDLGIATTSGAYIVYLYEYGISTRGISQTCSVVGILCGKIRNTE